MKVLLAPNSFKGSMTAYEAACRIEEGLRDAWGDLAQIEKCPVADGGDGTMDALVRATSGRFETAQVCDPLGRSVPARYGVLGDGKTAVIEMAAASGLALLSVDERNPMRVTTYGTGELIARALEQGVRRIVLGIGGSATVDGGSGLAQALGIRLWDEQGQPLSQGAQGLLGLARIDPQGAHPALAETEFEIACDVENPLLGETGAAKVYGPQKGATPEMVMALEEGLRHFADILARTCGRSLERTPGTGAGGGTALPLLAFAHGRIRKGVDVVLDACDFDRKLENCSLVITGEGRIDGQTASGKAPAGVARRAAARHVPTIAICGCAGEDAHVVHRCGIAAFLTSLRAPVPEHELQEKGPAMLRSCARELGLLIRTARALPHAELFFRTE